ncbi:hypothetical protein LCGC14_0422080 [marine sediment metagenome]|uniref:Uncharacterized protein n=1 Tax=marine sediment metagenome TaxID=412755 RepID=A0A0F9VZT9_9ZZZZ
MNIFTSVSKIESATGLWNEVRNSSKWYSFIVLGEETTAFSQTIKYSPLVRLEFSCEAADLTSIIVSKQLGSQIDCELYAKRLLYHYTRKD